MKRREQADRLLNERKRLLNLEALCARQGLYDLGDHYAAQHREVTAAYKALLASVLTPQ